MATTPRPRPWHALLPLALLGGGCTYSQVWFTGEDDVESIIVGELDTISTSAHVAIYTLTSEPIRDALINAHYRADVKVVADAAQGPINATVINALEKEGVAVREVTGWQGGIMHHKFIVLDGERVLTGSYNFTLSANTINDENLLLLADPRLAERYEEAFQELWSREND